MTEASRVRRIERGALSKLERQRDRQPSSMVRRIRVLDSLTNFSGGGLGANHQVQLWQPRVDPFGSTQPLDGNSSSRWPQLAVLRGAELGRSRRPLKGISAIVTRRAMPVAPDAVRRTKQSSRPFVASGPPRARRVAAWPPAKEQRPSSPAVCASGWLPNARNERPERIPQNHLGFVGGRGLNHRR
jgi:hypothetical protein